MSGLTRTIVLIDPDHRRNPEDPEAIERYRIRMRALGMLDENIRIRTFHTNRAALGWLLTTAETSPDQLPVSIVSRGDFYDEPLMIRLGIRSIPTHRWDPDDDLTAAEMCECPTREAALNHLSALLDNFRRGHQLHTLFLNLRFPNRQT